MANFLNSISTHSEYEAYPNIGGVFVENNEIHYDPMIDLTVDLGLTSGTLWCTSNLGSHTPEGYGDYYAWGAIVPAGFCDLSTAPYHYGNEITKGWTKYCSNSSYGTRDNKYILDEEDDAAYVLLGPEYRIPTRAQFQELLNETTQENTTYRGVAGRKYKSKVNSNFIFIPYAGKKSDETVYNAGGVHALWTRDNYYDYTAKASAMYGNSVSAYNRWFGFSIRPVKVKIA